MGVRSGRSRVADLAFQVFGQALHPEWFATRAHRRIHREDWQADVRVIDGGHVVHWAHGPVRLTEVLGAADLRLPEAGLLYHSAIRQERSTTLGPAETVEYQTCFESERLDREVFFHICDELILDAPKTGLFHRFEPGNRLAPSPISRLHIESRVRGLSVHTFHTFPEELTIVRTQSLFEVRSRVPR